MQRTATFLPILIITLVICSNGNMTTRNENGVTYTQVFDAENRLVQVSYEDPLTHQDLITQFQYDGDGNLIKKILTDDSYVLYFGEMLEIEKSSPTTVLHTTLYYPVGSALRVSDGVDEELYYVLKDQLSSASVVVDDDGDIVGEARYYPFGETRLSYGSMLTDMLFTGQRAMEDLGIYHYGARFYSPALGRFLSADTVVPGAGNSQAYDRYSYVWNNPIRKIDRNGHFPADPFDPSTYPITQEAIDFFTNLGWAKIGDPTTKNIFTNGADLVFKQDARVLAVELKDISGTVNLGTLGRNALGMRGGSIDQIVRTAGRFASSSIAQLRAESEAILTAKNTNQLINALYSNAKGVSQGACDIFTGVYNRAKDGVADTIKAIPPAASSITKTVLEQGIRLINTTETLFFFIILPPNLPMQSPTQNRPRMVL